MGAVTFTIANGDTKSNAVNAGGCSLFGLNFPTMTCTALSIQGSATDVDADFKTIGDEAAAFSITNPSGRCVSLPPIYTYGFQFLRLVAGSAEGAARTITARIGDYVG